MRTPASKGASDTEHRGAALVFVSRKRFLTPRIPSTRTAKNATDKTTCLELYGLQFESHILKAQCEQRGERSRTKSAVSNLPIHVNTHSGWSM